MKKKIILVLVAFISISVYVVSSNGKLLFAILNYRLKIPDSPFGSDFDRYGNLYTLSFLPQFRLKDPLMVKAYPDSVKTGKRDINLYVLCNSYIFAFVKTDKIFTGVKRYWFARHELYDNPVVKFDSTQKNIMLIEVTEHSLGNFTGPDLLMNSLKTVPSKNSADTLPSQYVNPTNYAMLAPLKNMIFNPRINDALGFNLFGYIFTTPIKQAKAGFNYNVFNRVDPSVKISPDGKHLFAAPTVDPRSHRSSFKPIDDEKINMYVTSFNKAYDHYKSLGFDEVYLTIVPNPVAIIAPEMGTYNHLTERIQNHPDMRMPFIDIYTVFKNSKEPIFQRSDTHWNYNGFRIWVDEFNKVLAKHVNAEKQP
ncbi:MAG: hypothetical protein EOP47_21485 [Sphingobacteriaceae bacterium]|nr:MAG: hypothetical protein EOP47_21485 [Sphingobacteriaceae bacterium]